jgi:endo-1,4-beta-D-glucanase Y
MYRLSLGMTHDFTGLRLRQYLLPLLILGLGCRPPKPTDQVDAGLGKDSADMGPDLSKTSDAIPADLAQDILPDVTTDLVTDILTEVAHDLSVDVFADLPADLPIDTPPDVGPDMGPDSAPSCVTTPLPQSAKFPFPQNRWGKNCIYPTNYSNDDVQRAYCQWKKDTVTTDGVGSCTKGGCFRVKRPNEPGSLEKNSTVSEGVAYGMLIAVYMNDQKLFDGLWKYEQQYLDERGLMHWYIKADGSGPASGGNGAATDADEDMAFALIMADKQWGGEAKLLDKTYLEHAKGLIGNIWNNEILDSKGVRPGDSWGGWDTQNISYFAPSYYKIFAAIDGGHAWNDVVTTAYDVIDHTLNDANGNKTNGLVPAWASCSETACSPTANAWRDKPGQSPTNYQYDSCRTPFRIGLDYCWNGNARAKDYVAKTSAFFSNIGASKIVDGYALNGTPQPASSGKSAAFIGPAAVGAMSSSSYQSFVNDAYKEVATLQALTGGTYYDESWTMLSLLAMTGNFIDFTAN